MKEPDKPSASLLRPCSAELPERDGYYWMRNTVDEGRAIWRIVNVFSRGHPERNGMQRIARDCCSVFTQEDLSDWQGVQFYGPLIPPNDRAKPMTGAPPKPSDCQKPLPGAPVIGFSDLLGVCIVCGSTLLLRIWRGHPDNAKIHCNDCGSEIPLYLHNQRNKI